MIWITANTIVVAIGTLHVIFMLGELLPWKRPQIMAIVIGKWFKPLALGPNEEQFAASIVHNAGIYNGLVAAGLFSTVISTDPFPIQVTLIIGGIVAGLFGAMTLSKATVVQAVLGAIALTCLLCTRH